MKTIRVIVRNGRLETNEPVNLPDGTELMLPLAGTDLDLDDIWEKTPEGFAAWQKWFDSLEPLSITPQEEADTEDWERRCDAYEAAKLNQEEKEF